MDHLLLPDGVKPWIVVPYHANPAKWYENDDQSIRPGFLEYPKRRGWTDSKVLGNVVFGRATFGDEKNEDVESFFQTWLFFGLIIEVLKLGNVDAATEDFLLPQRQKDARIVNTKKLPGLIAQWKQNVDAGCQIEGVWDVMDSYFKRTGDILDHFCAGGKTSRMPEQYGNVLWPVSDEVTTSIIAAGWALKQASCHIYDKLHLQHTWPVTNSLILHKRLERKLCKSDASMLAEDFDIDGQYYAAAAQGRSQNFLDEHYRCTADRCNSVVVDATYETKHAEGCRGDDYYPQLPFGAHLGRFDPGEQHPRDWEAAVRRIMKNDDFPFALWVPDKRKILSATWHRKDEAHRPAYVAISHVWADGMGNPYNNSLPLCQLDRIQGLVDDLCNNMPDRDWTERAGFWMDTLCCLVGPNDRWYRKKSIREMRHVYGNAVAVLVIEPWLTAIPSTTSPAEMAYHIYTAGWSRRLWTHQEGYLGKKVYYQFNDKAVSLSDIQTQIQTYQTELVAQGTVIQFADNGESKAYVYYSLIKEVIDRILQGKDPEEDRWMLYLPLADSLGYRSTSHATDEMLCVPCVLGLDVDEYQSIDFTGNNNSSSCDAASAQTRTAEARMVHFLDKIARFDTGLVFNNYARLTTPGYRWAPRSLLGHRTSGLGAIGQDKDALLAQRGRNRGLPVEYPGYVFSFKSSERLTLAMAERRFGVRPEMRGRRQLFEPYVVAAAQNDVRWERDADYAILFSEQLGTVEEGLAMLGRYSYDGDEELHVLESLCAATVRKNPSFETWAGLDMVVLEVAQRHEKWFVT